MIIAYYPRRTSPNIYSDLVVQALSRHAAVRQITPKRLDDVLWLLRRRPRITVVNWLENLCVKRNGSISCFGAISCFAWFLFLRLVSKKLVYVRHNTAPHAARGLGLVVSRLAIAFFERRSNLAVTHSRVEAVGRVYLPHPLYPIETRCADAVDSVGFLFFGMITKDKGLLELVECWGQGQKLTIAGTCHDASFLERLQASAGTNVEIWARYIPDREISRLFAGSIAVLVPNTGGTALVSGAFMHAVSYGKPIIAVSSPFLRDILLRFPQCGLVLADRIHEIPRLAENLHFAECTTDLRSAEFSDAQFQEGVLKVFNELGMVPLGSSMKKSKSEAAHEDCGSSSDL